MKRFKKTAILIFVLVAVGVGVTVARRAFVAFEIASSGDLYWDEYAECSVETLDDTALMERLVIVRQSDSETVYDETADTGVQGFDAPGTGLAVTAPWVLSVETDDYPRELHQQRHGRWWQVYGDCGEGVMTYMLCIIPLDADGNPIPTDDECCWDGEVFTGTAPIPGCFPLILRGW